MLKKEKRKAVSVNPGILLLYGAPKVGKTTMLSKLDDCLVIDTEQGGNMLDGYFETVDSKDELLQFYASAAEGHDTLLLIPLTRLLIGLREMFVENLTLKA